MADDATTTCRGAVNMNATLATLLAAVASAAVTVAAEAAPAPGINAQGSAIVVQDQASLRAARATVPSSRPACGRAKCSKCAVSA